MKVSQLLTEGAFVVKSKDGVEKRFKNPDSPEAKAWKEKTVGKKVAPEDKEANKQLKKDIEGQADRLVWMAIHTISEWGELDWIDLFNMTAKPHLIKAVKKNPLAYPQKFVYAVRDLEHNDTIDALYPYLNRAVKSAKAAGSWNGYVRQMTSYAKGIKGN